MKEREIEREEETYRILKVDLREEVVGGVVRSQVGEKRLLYHHRPLELVHSISKLF